MTAHAFCLAYTLTPVFCEVLLLAPRPLHNNIRVTAGGGANHSPTGAMDERPGDNPACADDGPVGDTAATVAIGRQ